MITRGRITAGPADVPLELSECDSIRFDGSRPHVYQGHTQRNRAVLLMFHTEG